MRWALIALAAVLMAGCQSIAYYTQAFMGHSKVMAKARPLDEWLADPAADAPGKEEGAR